MVISALSHSNVPRENSDHDTQCESPFTNPDLTGIGMRVSLYFQTFILALAPVFLENSRALRNIFSNTLLSSLALMAVTLVNVHNIAFIDGVAVTFLQSILMFTAFMQVEVLIALRDRTIWNMYLLAGLLRTILEIIFWGNIDAPSPLTCPNGIQQQQTTRAQEVRYIAIAFLGLALFLAVPFSILARYHGPRKSRNHWRIILVPATCIGIILQIYIIEFIMGTDDSVSGRANSWTHGQILSLLLVGSNIVDFVSALRSRRRDFHLFSWRGLHLDYDICKTRLRRRLGMLSPKASKRSSRSTRFPPIMLADTPLPALVAPEITSPPTCLTTDCVENSRRHSQRNYIISRSTYAELPYTNPQTLNEGVHGNSSKKRPQLVKVSAGESTPNIHFSTNITLGVLEGDPRTRPPLRPRLWSF